MIDHDKWERDRARNEALERRTRESQPALHIDIEDDRKWMRRAVEGVKSDDKEPSSYSLARGLNRV